MADIQFPALRETGIKDVADLRESESHRKFGLHRCPHNFARISVYPGGYIQTEHRLAACIDQFNDLLEKPFHLPVQTGSEKGIHNAVTVKDIAANLFERIYTHRVDGQLIKNIQIGPGSSLKFFRIRQQKYLDKSPIRENFPGDDKAIAAVVPPSTENYELLAPDADLPVQNSRRRQSRILHEDFFRNGKIFNGISIHGAHFPNTANSHNRSLLALSAICSFLFIRRRYLLKVYFPGALC
ncbi:MAG: hypothetical protein A4E66_02586 [Syntrophus sp. PtaB.Bin001]|nr:MAG: hypothetical protein A4E66_02586 [Syntrophus sp. PtaB.Bin001]